MGVVEAWGCALGPAAVGLVAVREVVLGLFDGEVAAFGALWLLWLLAAGALAPPLLLLVPRAVPLTAAGLTSMAWPAACAVAVGATVAVRRLNASAAAESWLRPWPGGRSQGLLRDAVRRVMTALRWLRVPLS